MADLKKALFVSLLTVFNAACSLSSRDTPREMTSQEQSAETEFTVSCAEPSRFVAPGKGTITVLGDQLSFKRSDTGQGMRLYAHPSRACTITTQGDGFNIAVSSNSADLKQNFQGTTTNQIKLEGTAIIFTDSTGQDHDIRHKEVYQGQIWPLPAAPKAKM